MAATRRSARGVSAYEVSMPFVPMKAVLLDGGSAGCLVTEFKHLISAMRRLSAQTTLVKHRQRSPEHLISAMRRLSALDHLG